MVDELGEGQCAVRREAALVLDRRGSVKPGWRRNRDAVSDTRPAGDATTARSTERSGAAIGPDSLRARLDLRQKQCGPDDPAEGTPPARQLAPGGHTYRLTFHVCALTVHRGEPRRLDASRSPGKFSLGTPMA